jgi:phosphoenolpyruvate carboxylase
VYFEGACDHHPRRTSGAPSRDFDSDAALLTDVLDEVIRCSEGEGAIELRDRAVALGRATRAGDPAAPGMLAELIAELELDETELLVRSLSRWFQLVNLAEDNERVRRLRRRVRIATSEAAQAARQRCPGRPFRSMRVAGSRARL